MRSFVDSVELSGALIDALPDALVLVDGDGRIVAVNARVEELLGYQQSELLAKSLDVLIPEQLRGAHEQRRKAYTQSPARRPMAAGRELSARHKDGSEVSVLVALSPLASAQGRLVVAVLRETPDHLPALRLAEERYRSAIEQAPDAVFVADLQGRYTEVNSAACRMLGYAREQLIGKTIMELIPPEDLARLAATRAQLLKPGEVQVSEWTLLRADGVRLPVEVSAKIHADGRWQAFARDISERKRMVEVAVRTLRELETVLDTIPDPVAVRVGDNFEYVNRALLRVLGYGEAREMLRRPVLDSVHPDDRSLAVAWMERVNQTGRAQPMEVRLLAKDGSSVPLELAASLGLSYRGRPAALLVAHDRREWKRLEAALGERDRLATVGTLAAGVGHEINNPLQNITMTLELLREELIAMSAEVPARRVERLLELADDARLGAQRIAKIVRGLDTFARGEREEAAVLDLHTVLDLSISLTGNQLRHHVQLHTDLRATPLVFCDESRLAQVFINLLTNAAQAMADRPAERNVLRVCSWTDERGRAVVEIGDNGPGMTDEVRARVFEPFFTTKPVGEGSGLGLAIAHSIVTSFGGELSCASELGVGSTFLVRLPASTQEDVRPAQRRRQSGSVPRRGRILVVEDDPVVAALVERVLSADHHVERAADGLQGLARLASEPRYDVILCDLMMPNMSGIQLYQRVLSEQPELGERFVFMTGGATGGAQAFLDGVPNRKLAKPFSMLTLRELVNDVLNQPRRLPSVG